MFWIKLAEFMKEVMGDDPLKIRPGANTFFRCGKSKSGKSASRKFF